MGVRGGGFEPGATLRIARDGVVVATVQADVAGEFSATVPGGPLPAGVAEAMGELTVADAAASATQRFRVTRFGASYAPRAASPRSLVRFSAFGFGPGRAVYVHYLAADGTAAKTIRLGPTRGVCGTIRRTAPRRLFPFRPRPGAWRLQFDTARRFDPNAVPRLVLPVRVR